MLLVGVVLLPLLVVLLMLDVLLSFHASRIWILVSGFLNHTSFVGLKYTENFFCQV